MQLTLTVNDTRRTADVAPGLLLVDFLRDRLRLTGTHVGCDTCQCGACTIHIDGQPVKACTVLAVACEGKSVRTIEGLARNGNLHPMQEAFRDCHGLQCGFCTPGMVMTAVGLVEAAGEDLTETAIREGLEGNLCRCTGYANIVRAISAGGKAMRGG